MTVALFYFISTVYHHDATHLYILISKDIHKDATDRKFTATHLQDYPDLFISKEAPDRILQVTQECQVQKHRCLL